MAKATTKPKKTSGSKNKKVKKTETIVTVEEPVVETPVVVQEETTVEPVETNYDNEFQEINTQLKQASLLIKELMTHVTRLEKRVVRDRRIMNKKMKGRAKRNVDPNKPPSGFAKPGLISEELRKFLGLPKGELIARTEVTKKITAYCKEHDLQKEEDKRTILADAPLRKLLKMNEGDELTFFNLQKYMKIHYPKKEKA